MVGERLSNMGNREPIVRAVSNRFSGRASKIRNRPGKVLENTIPKLPNRNLGGGVAVGAIGAVIIRAVKDYIPLATDVDIVGTQDTDGGVLYTINVDAPMMDVAEFEAFMESASGLTSIITDSIDIQDTKVLKTRMVKDTYEIKVLVQD